MTHFDTIVVGVGGMGSAAVWQLAKRGQRVLGLEQFDVPHDFGSSHGVTRIIRLAYYEDPSYVPLLRRAYELWEELGASAGEPLLVQHGSIDAGPEDDYVFRGSYESCVAHGIPHEVLEARELEQRFPGYHLPRGHYALFQRDGGFLLSERCIVQHVLQAQRRGARVQARERVVSWRAEPDRVVVETDRGRYEAGSLVVTAGPWAKHLLPLGGNAQAERQVLGWFAPRSPERFTPERFPVFNLSVPEGRYYGFPEYGVPGFKIGRYHHLAEQVEADAVDRSVTPYDEAVLRDAVTRYFPDADGPTMALKTCLFTNSPDEHFIIGRHPEHDNVAFAAGFSGHGYKFCSVVGEILADLAVDGTTALPISLFSPTRAALRSEPGREHAAP